MYVYSLWNERLVWIDDEYDEVQNNVPEGNGGNGVQSHAVMYHGYRKCLITCVDGVISRCCRLRCHRRAS